MRRPWIKIETSTPDKPEVCSIATHLRIDEDMVMGKLVRLWSWAELNRINPNDLGVTKEFIDKLVGRKGFAQALEKAGWLEVVDGKLVFPNFKRHNSPVAQNKALTAKRVARHRLRKAKTNEKVTKETVRSKEVIPAEIEPKVEETPHDPNDVLEVKNPDIDLEISEAVFISDDEEQVVTEPIPEQSNTAAEAAPVSVETTVQEEGFTLQAEEAAPRKKRSKATVDSGDQPMLF